MLQSKLSVHYVLCPTISEDVYIAIQEAAQRRLQRAVTVFGQQGGGDGFMSPLDDQHGRLDCTQAGVHELGLGNVSPCEITGETKRVLTLGLHSSLRGEYATMFILLYVLVHLLLQHLKGAYM